MAPGTAYVRVYPECFKPAQPERPALQKRMGSGAGRPGVNLCSATSQPHNLRQVTTFPCPFTSLQLGVMSILLPSLWGGLNESMCSEKKVVP